MIINQKENSRSHEDVEYREIPYLNYSSIKVFDDNRNKFYRQVVMKEVFEEDRSDSVIFGDLVHCLLLTPEELDSKFAMMTHIDFPKPQMKAFVDNLWKLTTKCLSENGEVTRTAESLLEDAFNETAFGKNGERIAFKGKDFDYVVKKFLEEGEEYYKYLRENFGKPVINPKIYENAEKIVKELKANMVTSTIVNAQTDEYRTVLKEFVITFNYNDVPLKAKCDLIVIDHSIKTIHLYDLKSTGWDTSQFEVNILKRKYYLQWSLYYLAVQSWAKENGYSDYRICGMEFIVISTDTNESPLIYTTSHKDLSYGINGFTTKIGKKYKGLNQLLTEILWHYSFSIWDMSYTDYQNNGIRKVSLFEEIA